jgi:release factor H-coupled RctB family protein
LWQTDLRKGRVKLSKLVERLENMGGMQSMSKVSESKIAPPQFDSSLGTIGGGNHFAELQGIKEVFDEEVFQSSGLDEQALFLLVHSGSRGLGEHIYREHCGKHGNKGLPDDSADAVQYLAQHDHAVAWAGINRQRIATRFFDALQTRAKPVLDVSHNFVESETFEGVPCWLHRKGAAPSDKGPVVIPGSRQARQSLFRQGFSPPTMTRRRLDVIPKQRSYIRIA